MPIYEYEPVHHDCLMCDGRVQIIQAVTDEPYQFCPHCGLEVKKVVSQAGFSIRGASSDDAAAKKGFTTYRRSEFGVWEKTAGSGADYLVGSDEDKKQIEAEKAAKKVKKIDLTDL